MLYVKPIFRHGWKIFRDLYGWFLHLWRFIWSMSSQCRTYPQMMHREEFDIELEKVPLHGTTWNCPRPQNFQESEWSGQSEDRCHSQASHTQMCERYPIFLGHSGFYHRSLRTLVRLWLVSRTTYFIPHLHNYFILNSANKHLSCIFLGPWCAMKKKTLNHHLMGD